MQMGIIILESLLFNLIFNCDDTFDQMYKVIGKRRETKFKIGIGNTCIDRVFYSLFLKFKLQIFRFVVIFNVLNNILYISCFNRYIDVCS